MTTAISIDLETLKARYDAAILSIGAAVIDLDTGTLGETFYREITLDSAMKAGGVSADTLSWWLNQSEKARRVFASGPKKKLLVVALDELRTFVLRYPKATIWGNGASFDISILEYAYDHGTVGMSEPWSYWSIRDMRTIVDVANIDKKDYPSTGTHHNALDDAVFQAQVISAAWRKVRGALGLLPEPKASKPVKKPVPATEDEDDL